MSRRVARLSVLATITTLTPAAIAAETPPIVRVYVAGSAEAVSGSRDAIQDLCSRANVAVVVHDAAGADEALLATSHALGLAEAYVDLRPGTAPRVVVVDGETRRDLERRTLPEGTSLEISIETAAHVVCMAVESSLAARATPPLVKPASAPQDRPAAAHWQSQVSLFVSASDFGAGLRGGAGLALGASRGLGSLRFGGDVSLSGYPSADIKAAGGLASFGSIGARVMPVVEWQATRLLTLFSGLGLGCDWLRIEAGQPPPGTTAETAHVTVDAMAAGMLGLRLRLGSGVAALLALDADLDLSRHRYVIQTPEGSQSFFEPARVRPLVLAGLSLSLGSERASESPPRREARR